MEKSALNSLSSFEQSHTIQEPFSSPSARIASIDVFRGLTMTLMIFVNDLADVKGLPWWNYHMHASDNGMTYVDMVFPAFLFIVGMSIPLAIRRRIEKGITPTALWLHVLARTLALLVLGIALANAEKGDPRLMGIGRNTWILAVLIGAILFWNIYPRSSRFKPMFTVLRWLGLLLMVSMFVVFRRMDQSNQVAWLDFSYWEILGLIGWTYLSVCLLYIPTRRARWMPVAWLVLFTLLNALSAAGWLHLPDGPPIYNGGFVVMTMAGVVTATIFFGMAGGSLRKKLIRAAVFAVILLVLGTVLLPLGVSKIRATPTWCLYSAGASVFVFMLLYWTCDIKRKTRWAAFARPAGSNTLLTYLLPDLFYYALPASLIPEFFGVAGAVKSAVFTALMLVLAALLTRLKVRLQL